MKKTGIWLLIVTLVAVMPAHPAEAKKKTPKLSVKNLSMKKGEKTKVAVKNASPKKTSWTVNKAGKKVVTLSGKKKKCVTVRAKKAGQATLTARVRIKGKIKKLKAKVKVTTGKTNLTADKEKQPAFPGTVTASLTSDGYVMIQWTKVADAHAYVVQRKSGSGTWEQVKVTASRRYTDTKVEEYTSYSYRVKANRGFNTTAFSSGVAIKTGEIKKAFTPIEPGTPIVPPAQDGNDFPSVTPSEKPEPTPYQAKYHYEIKVLNQFNIYDTNEEGAGYCPIVLYIKTDNPNPNGDGDGVELWLDGINCIGSVYEDIEYQEQEESESTFFYKADGGWIYTATVGSPGIKNVVMRERRAVVGIFSFEVKDGKKALKEHCNKVMQTVSDDGYNEDGRGKWSELSMQDKLERLEDYVRNTMHYPRVGALTSLGYKPIWVIQENVGAFWETGFADCGAANELMCALARTLGLEAKRKNTVSDGQLHIVAAVTIDGSEYIYDATPWQGGYKDWDYLDLSKY